VAYKEFNKNTVEDKFSISIIKGLIDELGSATIFSKIDFRINYL